MADNFQDLFDEFGSKSKSKNASTEFDDLFQEFGSGKIKATPTKEPTLQSNIPQPGVTNVGPGTGYEKPNVFVEEASKVPGYLNRKIIEHYTKSKELSGQGVTDITRGKPATGIGEMALGGLGMVAAPLSAGVEGATRLLEKASGNKEFAERASLVGTSGIPIAKTGSVISKAMPSTRAIDTLVNTIGKENLPAIIKELKSNPRLTLMDVDPNAQRIAMGLASKLGKPLKILDDFVKVRKSEQHNTVVEAYDEALGVPVNLTEKIDSLKKQVSNKGREINPIVANSKPVDISTVIADIDSKLKPGVQSIITAGQPLPGPRVKEELADFRKLLSDDKSMRTDAKELHQLQSALRAKAEDLLNSQSGQDRQVGYALMNVRNQIVEAIDRASPQIIDTQGKSIGTYKSKLAEYREENLIPEAFNKGLLITRNRLGRLEDDPTYWEKWLKSASDAEKEAAVEGARLAVSHQMGAFKKFKTNEAGKGLDLPQIEFNTEKLKLLLGEKETNKLLKTLKDERRINETDVKLIEGSMTAMREAAKLATQVRESYKPNAQAFLPAAAEIGAASLTSGQSIGLVAPAIIGYHAVRKAIRKGGQKLDEKTNVEIANLASATGVEKDNLIQMLEAQLPNPKLPLTKKLQLAFPVKP